MPRTTRIARALALLAFVLGTLVQVGWRIDSVWIVRGHPSLAAMNPTSALCCQLCSVALLLATGRNPIWKFLPALPVLGLCLVRIAAEAAGHADLLDGLLLPGLAGAGGSHAGFAFGSAIGFGSLTGAIVTLDLRLREDFSIFEPLAIAAGNLALLSLLDIMTNARVLQNASAQGATSLWTALSILMLSCGVLCVAPERGVLGAIRRGGQFVQRTRSMLISAVIVPPAVGLGFAALFGPAFGIAISATLASTTMLFPLRRVAELGAEVDRLTGQLRQSNHDLSEFAYVAAHDLRAPLRAIRSLASWIEESLTGPASPEVQSHFSTLYARVDRLDKMTCDLLEYAQLDSHPQAVQITTEQLLDALRSALAVPSGFSLELRSSLPHVQTVSSTLERVLVNLIGNSIKHHDSDCGRILVEISRSGSWLEISVSDDGPGISQENLERIFDLFVTLRSRDEVEGTGMGLSIARRIVQMAGGTISVSSEVGCGTTVRFTWPVSLSAALMVPA